MKLQSGLLKTAVGLDLPGRILGKIKVCMDEDEAYAADELVELAEEILNQLAASAISHYIRYSLQKDVYNDFPLELFHGASAEFNVAH